MREAVYYKQLNKGIVQCTLCPWNCIIPKGEAGHCNTRFNKDGVLYSLVYGEPTGFQVDPVEKKPLFHFHPGSRLLSFGTQGCNFRCEYCCNYYYSQATPEVLNGVRVKPLEIVAKALENNCIGIAYTYNEPSIFLEYAFDTAKLAHKKGLLNVFVTNAAINKEPLMDMEPYLDAAVIDFKGFNPGFYKEYVNADLGWVKEGLEYYSKLRAHKEVTNLVVPGLNDDSGEIRALSRFIIDVLGPDTPAHFLRFFPTYKMRSVPATPQSLISDCCSIAEDEGLRYVYAGNVMSDRVNTYCPYCGELLIKRAGSVESMLVKGRCPKCSEHVPINNGKKELGSRPGTG